MRNRLRMNDSGSAMVESALSLTLFFLIILGILDMGRMVYAYNFVSFAAREATRYAATHGTTNAATTSSITNFVNNEAISAVNINDLLVIPSWSSTTHGSGTTVTVKVAYTYTPLFSFVMNQSITFSSSSVMVISQ